MLITIDANGGEAVYDQVATAVAGQIADGALTPGTRLPAARDLAEALGVNVHTVLHAYQRLRDEGLIELRRGRGAVVIGRAATDEVRRAVAVLLDAAESAGVELSALIALIRKEHQS